MKDTRQHDPFWTKLHSIVTRCYCKTAPRYADYGGRGVGVWKGWYDVETGHYDVEAFRRWCLTHGYAPGLQIDRANDTKGYSPWNCRFVTVKENSRNRRSTILIEMGGKVQCAKDWCAELGVNYGDYNARVHAGWDHKRAFLVPLSWRRPHVCFFKGGKNGMRPHCYRKWKRNLCRRDCCECGTDEAMRNCPYFHEFTYEDLKSGWLEGRDRQLPSGKEVEKEPEKAVVATEDEGVEFPEAQLEQGELFV